MYLVGNWKMHQSLADIDSFFGDLSKDWPREDGGVQTWIAPQALHLEKCLHLGKKLGIAVGAQNCSGATQGAFTGELSPAALADLGAHFTLVGHSERRALFGEDHKFLGEKVKAALSQGLAVLFCMGETLEQRESEQTLSVLQEQIFEGLKEVQIDEASKGQLVFAYEPVWAIGTGRTATPEMANETHLAIRDIFEEKWGTGGRELPLLYGGSVKPDNARELLSREHIDGALVGGASLTATSYGELARIARDIGSQ